MYKFCVLIFTLAIIGLSACNDEGAQPQPVDLISKTINGVDLVDGVSEIALESTIELIFSSALDQALFEGALSIESAGNAVNWEVEYANQGSVARISPELTANTTYLLNLSARPISLNGSGLQEELIISFTTTSGAGGFTACTSGNADCLYTIPITTDESANFSFYASFPLFGEEVSQLSSIRHAIIVVHGANRNADDYFNYMMSTLKGLGKEQEVVLIAPSFQSDETASPGSYYWSGNGWRAGQNSNNSVSASSFSIVDQLIDQLKNYPDMEEIIVTGHSSGALFTHLFAAANQSEVKHPDFEFNYIIANSQYFYYPDERRMNESNNQLYVPNTCTGYDIWPLGYSVVPPYLSGVSSEVFNERFLGRSLLYLLGNGNGSDSSLNTTDCSATLLGSTRFARGENMFEYLEKAYPDIHTHRKAIVQGIGHDGQGMYLSSTFRDLLGSYLD